MTVSASVVRLVDHDLGDQQRLDLDVGLRLAPIELAIPGRGHRLRHQVVVRASTLLDVDGRLVAQLIEAATARWQPRPAQSGSPQPGCAHRVLWW
jgi:hypothetical protein